LFLILLLSGWISTTQASEYAYSAQWLNLIHYQKTLFGYKSEADGPGFFLSQEGKTNPTAELLATIQALHDPNTLRGVLKSPAACVFPARKLILERDLGLKFPEVKCQAYEEWRKGLPVTDLSLVFASAYPNNPASMFGHTFLRLKGPGDGRALLDYAVNFAATTGSDGGVEFALLGVFGGYQGHYSLAPYFIKVNEYNHGEARDLWEYSLKISAKGIDVLLAHLWEIEASSWFDYWFFDENCSWQILRLLEVATPKLKISNKAPFYIIPAETVRILQNAKLLGKPEFRPSLRRQYLARGQSQTQEEEEDKKLAYYQLKSRLKKLSEIEEKDYHQRLTKRAGNSRENTKLIVPEAHNSPHVGHGLRRVILSAGEKQEKLEVRLAQHDLLDQDIGYEPWSTLDVLRLSVEQQERIFVREITLAEVVSISPYNDLGWDISWFTEFGLDDPREFEEVALTAKGSGGFGYALGSDQWIMGLMLMGEALGNSPQGASVSLGVRSLVGIKGEKWKLVTDVMRLWGNRRITFEVSFAWSLSENWGLRVSRYQTDKKHLETLFSLVRYF
jgi:hypothetical protein